MSGVERQPILLSEDELRELKLRSFESAPTGIAISNLADGRFIYVNDRFCQISGFTKEQVIGATGQDLNMWVNPSDRETFANHLRETGHVNNLEYLFMRPNGERRIGQLAAELVMLNDQGRIVSTIIDVTERHHAKEQQQQSEARMRALARAAPDLTLITSPQGRILEVLSEPGREGFLTEKTDTLRGARIQDVLPASLSPLFQDALRLTVGSGEQQRIEYCLDLSSGTRWFEAVSAALRGSTDDVSAIMWVARDVTHRKQNEDAVRRESERRRFFARQLIEVQERERKRIARELHDDLGQILTALKLQTRRLIDQAAESQMVRDNGEILVEHLSTAMGSVRNLAAGLRPGILDDLGLGPALESLTGRIAIDGTPTITVQLDSAVESAPPETKTALYRIGQEALTNVARHANAREVAVTLALADEIIELKIVDDGCGITQTDLDNPIHLGITSMRERAGLLGGTLVITAPERGGTEVVARVPIR